MIELLLLGPVELIADGDSVALPAKVRALLVALALEAPRPVTNERLVDLVWDDDPPESAVKALQVYATQLRKSLGDRLRTVGGGYAVELDTDAARFEQLLAAGELEAALAVWRGPALAGLREPFARQEAARLDELRLGAIEDLADARLAAGHNDVAELERRAAQHPERERVHGQLMLALYRSGRQEDALAAYRRARSELVERAGIEPGPRLRRLHEQILRQDGSLDDGGPPGPPPGTPRPGRKAFVIPVVLVLLAFLAGGLYDLARRSSGNGDDAPLRTYTLKVENYLRQSHDARQEIVGTIGAAGRCAVGPARAAASIQRVQRSRQSLLEQLAALSVPPGALPSFDALQRAAQRSITADWLYRDWLLGRRRCVRGESPPKDVLAADAAATRAKQRFAAAFAPLARRFGQPTWAHGDF